MDHFRVEVSDGDGLVVAIEMQSLAGRDIGAAESKVICSAIEHLSGFLGAHYVDLTCHLDRLNPCWSGRPTDAPGKHWGGGEACPACRARAAME